MKLSDELYQAYLNQIKDEFYSSYLYFAIANYCDLRGLEGFASWFYKQADEEKSHAHKFTRFLLDLDMEVPLREIPSPPLTFGGGESIIRTAYEHEQYVSASISALQEMACQSKHKAARAMLDDFVVEQVEEEAQLKVLLDWISTVGGAQGATLAMLDAKLGERD
jgi:ferritin